ncbi:bifunctional YncE family protein/alkaline phosphatase family protein [Actinoallomurus purpureus]|uniref:bifunctional YncE family protein/alkaline phosphatase family protein n=1 Tax=Actinoallomurus purpureus TaxID=478114 RepID=UPI002093C6FF|nr:bifunctional YncE family protein/alkaline phosphatase family protein [Actinoallomurus purpureus]MCO6008628.1 bifunctional YncE family protein/alkaline phosphatase family protein [Actinoallomurus purpureus]
MAQRLLSMPVIGIALALATSTTAFAAGVTGHNKPLADHLVGRQADGSVLTPDNQYVTPAGASIEQSGRPMDLAVRPDGKTAVDLTKSGAGLFTVVDLVGQKVLQQYTPPKGTGSGNVGVGGLLYSPDGNTLWAAQGSDILKFSVVADGTLSNPSVVKLPADASVPKSSTGAAAAPLPTDLAWTPDGGHILVVLDGWDRLGVLDPATGTLTAQTSVGVAPRDVAIVGDHAYVSNEGGRKPADGDFTNLSYDSPVVADKVDGRASTGTVSEVDLATNEVVHTYRLGLDPSSLLAHGTELLVTNSSDDTVSIIDTVAQRVTQTFNVNPLPGQPFGSSPNALEFIDPSHLVVSLGRNNALAIYEYRGAHRPVAFDGLIPTAWYPGTLHWNATLDRLVVANQAGVGALGKDGTISEGPGTDPATGRQVYADVGTVGLVERPTRQQIATYTSQVFRNNQWNGLRARNRKGSRFARPTAVPVRIGAPSKIKHVFVIVKENRTYDQVLGDDPRGNGNPSYTQFGQKVTPNTHALAQQFPLIDNLYSDGTNSAVGHTWLDAGFVNDYLERSYANYIRDYGQPDAMVYPKSGFLWDNAQAHGLTAHVWGEYAEFWNAPGGAACPGTWADWYKDSQVLEGKATGAPHVPVGYCQTTADVPSLDKILSRDFPNFQTNIPDQYRADLFQRDFAQYETNGNLPALNMLWVMDDHTNGLNKGYPTPSAMVADNDLATGRIIDTISHSKYWKDSAVFVVEDDSQNGIDHVDGHRNVTLIASPYAKHGGIDHTYYSQLNVTRTIEQILGLPPMNQLDMAAEPMYGAFTDRPDYTPYTALPNQIPLDTMNGTAAQATDPMQKAWLAWSEKQNFKSEDQLAFAPFNRLTWYATTGWKRPYPGDSKVMSPDEVLKKFPQTVVTNGVDNDIPSSRAQAPHKAK